MSHGCVNMTTADAKWLLRLRAGWHAGARPQLSVDLHAVEPQFGSVILHCPQNQRDMKVPNIHAQASSQPSITSCRLTPAAKALSFHFLRMLLTLTSRMSLLGRTSATAVTRPVSSSTAYSALSRRVTRSSGRQRSVAENRPDVFLGQAALAQNRRPVHGMLLQRRVDLPVEVVQQADQAPGVGVFAISDGRIRAWRTRPPACACAATPLAQIRRQFRKQFLDPRANSSIASIASPQRRNGVPIK